MRRRAAVWLVMLFALEAAANMPSATSAVFTADPADCSSTDPAVCPDGPIADALDEFPFWDYAASTEGGGTHWFLGTSGGYLWSISCNHCGAGAVERSFIAGPWSGQVFDSFNALGLTGAFKQFNKVGNVPASSSANTGDILWRYKAKPGESLPVVPLMPVLQRLTDLVDGTIMVSIGNGYGGSHPTRGWFPECGRDGVQSGGPADIGDLDECCRPPRDADVYQPPTGAARVHSPPMSAASRTGYGGEGIFADCTDGSGPVLTYLGPVYGDGAETLQWATWIYRPSFLFRTEWPADEVRDSWSIGINYTGGNDPGRFQLDAEAPHSQGYCATVTDVDAAREWAVWAPPAAGVPTHVYCGWDPFAGEHPAIPTPTGSAIFSVGDSGGVTFAYIPTRAPGDRWVYIGSRIFGTSNLNTFQFRADYENWVLGITSGLRACAY